MYGEVRKDSSGGNLPSIPFTFTANKSSPTRSISYVNTLESFLMYQSIKTFLKIPARLENSNFFKLKKYAK